MAASHSSYLDHIPEEISAQIIQSVPVMDLPKVMLASRRFYRQAQSRLYRSVFYVAGDTLPKPDVFTLLGSITGTPPYYPGSGARIFRPQEFCRTIKATPVLRSSIDEVHLSLQEATDEDEVGNLMENFSALKLNIFHLTLTNTNATLALTNTLTSLDVTYPAEHELDELYESIQDHVYSLFAINSLRHLTLRDVRSWSAANTQPDDTKVRSSNVISLALPNTVPMDPDLREILTWPKGLQRLYHQNVDGPKFFNWSMDAHCASPEHYLRGISSQQESLEELYYNNAKDRAGDDESTFIPALISKFRRLRRLCVPQDCFVHDWLKPSPLYTMLPPNLQELYLELHGNKYETLLYEARLRERLQEVANHKEEFYPSLTSVTLWKHCKGDGFNAESGVFLERLSLGTIFEESGISLKLHAQDVQDAWYENM